jgi:uncharacterized protein (DUF58 family)
MAASNAKGEGGAGRSAAGLAVDGTDAALLAEIETLQLNARNAAHGALAGIHRSLRRGSSIEFSEHKVYTPGDDIRHIDWHAYAKTDRYHVKQFEDETNITLELIVDHSGSMAFCADDRPSKLETTRLLAAALGYLALRQGDAAGLLTYATDVTDELPARASSAHLVELLGRLARLSAGGQTGVRRSIDHFAQRTRRRTVAIIISDLFDPDPELMPAFRRLSARRHDVAVLHLLDAAEIEFPYENPSLFHSMEDGRKLFVHPRTLRAAYVEEMKRFLADVGRRMSEAGIDYHLVDTREPPSQVLGRFLRGRETRG